MGRSISILLCVGLAGVGSGQEKVSPNKPKPLTVSAAISLLLSSEGAKPLGPNERGGALAEAFRKMQNQQFMSGRTIILADQVQKKGPNDRWVLRDFVPSDLELQREALEVLRELDRLFDPVEKKGPNRPR